MLFVRFTENPFPTEYLSIIQNRNRKNNPFDKKKSRSPFRRTAQTVDKGARTHTGANKFVSKANKSTRKKVSDTVSNRVADSMLAVFSDSTYRYTPIVRRKRHRSSFLGSLPACRKCFFDKLSRTFVRLSGYSSLLSRWTKSLSRI